MTKLKRFSRIFGTKKNRTIKLRVLDTGISSALIATTDNIQRIEVFQIKVIDPLGVTLGPIASDGPKYRKP